MTFPETAYAHLAPDLRICRILNGLWQVSGAHGPIEPSAAIRDMFLYHETGFTTWDLADHYGPAEDFVGEFRRQLVASRGPDALSGIAAFTKWVPRPVPMSRALVEQAIARSQRRMDMETLDLLQFHWWEYEHPAYLDALAYLAELQTKGKIRHLGLTNFDSAHLQRVLDHGVPVVSNQVQYSLIDRRPEVNMAPLCGTHNIRLLTYGTLCGGLLSERYLGQPEPGYRMLTTASLQKYKQMIDAWGGWALFQELLQAVKGVAERHGVSIANVAVRYVLDRPAVGGVIVGARLGASEHRQDNAAVFGLSLDPGHVEPIEEVLARSRDLYALIGDCGDEYRR